MEEEENAYKNFVGKTKEKGPHGKRRYRRQDNIKIDLNPLTPNDHYMGRTAQLTSRRCILYIYSTNKRTEYFKHAA